MKQNNNNIDPLRGYRGRRDYIKFEDVYSNYESWDLNVNNSLYIINPDYEKLNLKYKTYLYNSLYNLYNNGYFKYITLSVIYQKTINYIQDVVNKLIYLNFLENTSVDNFYGDNIISNEYGTDNDGSQNEDNKTNPQLKFLVSQNETINISGDKIKKFNELKQKVRNDISKELEGFNTLMLPNIVNHEGEEYE